MGKIVQTESENLAEILNIKFYNNAIKKKISNLEGNALTNVIKKS
jgi:hypothetical protein